MSTGGSTQSHLRLLLALSARRARAALRHPTAPAMLGAALPALVLLSALWTLGGVGVPSPDGSAGGLTLGLLVSGTLTFLAYGSLFGGADNLFLRQLGIDPGALFLERVARLSSIGLGTVVALAIPYLAAGSSAVRPLIIATAAAAIAIAGVTLMYAWAARAVTRSELSLLAAGVQWDTELAKAAPLVYAPVLPFLAGALAGAVIGGATRGVALLLAGAIVIATAAVLVASRIFATAAARFLPHAGELAYTPPPAGEGERFRVGRGLSALLPRRAGAVWVRDAAVAGRRFAWAARVSWPVAIAAIVVLARWGENPATRVWVLAAVGVALVIQSSAVVALGLVERHGPRWIDRAAGVAAWERFLGRWAWSWGLSLWLLGPVALAWWWWSGAEGAWAWPIAGAAAAALATTASLLNAERR